MSTFSVEPNERVTFRVRYEDEHLLVVEKPSRLVSQPGKGHEQDSLLNGLFARHGRALQQLGSARDFGLLHRLDRETSGLLIVALTSQAHAGLSEAFRAREIRKYYWAVTRKAPTQPQGVIRMSIAERTRRTGRYKSIKTAAIATDGKPAVTAYRVIEANGMAALLECRAVTGRLHQVRVHLNAIGCPILGDRLYAKPAVADASPRLALHAHRLAFDHPVTGEAVDVQTSWPRDLRALLRRLELARPDLDHDEPNREDQPSSSA